MGLWTAFIDFLEAVLFVGTQACGGNLGWGIVLVSLALRLGLLPLTYRAACDARKRSQIMLKLKPQLDRLQARHQKDPVKMAEGNARLMRSHGLPLFDRSTLLGAIVQTPFAIGMYSVIRRVLSAAVGSRFLWIRDIARPDPALALLVSASVLVVALINPQLTQQASRWQVCLPAVITLFFLFKLNSGLGLYWGASTLVGGIQAVMVRRQSKTLPA